MTRARSILHALAALTLNPWAWLAFFLVAFPVLLVLAARVPVGAPIP